MKAYVTFIQIQRIEASGACNVKTAELIHADDLRIQLSGASDFTGELKADKLRLDGSGASVFKVAGTAESVQIGVSGACDVKGYDLKAGSCKIDASGASSVRITTTKELMAQASGGSDIYYKGPGLVKEISASGGLQLKENRMISKYFWNVSYQVLLLQPIKNRRFV